MRAGVVGKQPALTRWTLICGAQKLHQAKRKRKYQQRNLDDLGNGESRHRPGVRHTN